MKKLNKLLVTALLSLNIYGGDTATPASALHHYDSGNWPGFYEYFSDATLSNTKTAVQLDDVMGMLINRGIFKSFGEYGIYSKNIDNTVVIENYGNISGSWAGVDLAGTNGNLNNYGIISSSDYGIVVDPDPGNTSNINDFWIKNAGTITSTNLGIWLSNGIKKLYLNNTQDGNITGNTYAVLAGGDIELINDGLIQSQNSAALVFIYGADVINNGIIQTFGTSAVSKSIMYLGLNGTPLTLKGSGSYIGNIAFAGDPTMSMHNGILNIKESDGIDFKNARLENWGSVDIYGGNHYFNVQNDAQNTLEPFTYVSAKNNAYIHTGAGSWGDARFTLDNNSLLNPYKNQYDVTGFYWDRPALKLDTNDFLYDRKEFEKLTVRDLNIKNGSALVMDVRYSEPDYHPDNAAYDEDDRAGYWDDLNLVEGEHDPDGSYGGFGYSDRVKKVHDGGPGDLYTYQRVNYDKINVAGTTDIESGTKLYLLDHTKWLNDDGLVTGIPGFVEETGVMKEITVDLFDGNIQLDDFDIDFYSDYYGIDRIDNNSGKVYLTRDAYGSNVKSQIDWWLKEASLGFPELNPLTAEQAAAAQTTAAPMMMMSRMAAPMAQSVVETYVQPEEVLPYAITQDYNLNITDFAASLALKEAIYSFTSWDDVDTFLDSVNKLEYASLTTSNLNAISNRIDNIYTQLANDYKRDSNGFSFWVDTYVFDDSLQGNGNHDVSGNGYEITAGFDKKFGKFTLGFSFNHTDYSTDVNDSGSHTTIDSDGYGLNMFAQYDQGKLTHRAIVGYGQQNNTDDVANFDSSEMFTSYRAEYAVNKNITLIGGLRYASVKYDDINLGDNNGIESEIHDSLETELGLRLSKQFKKLTVNVSASWMHELLDTHNTVRVNSVYGSFNQEGITRDADSYRLAVGAAYQLTEKMSIGVEAAREMSAHADSNSVAAKFRISF